MLVYLVLDEWNSAVKIGFTTDLDRRLAALQCAHAHKLKVIRTIEGTPWTERWLHNRFRSKRLHGEWFSYSDDMMTVAPPKEPTASQTSALGRRFTTALCRRLEECPAGELAQDIGVSVNTVYGWAAGISLPRLEYYARLCSYFGFDFNDEVMGVKSGYTFLGGRFYKRLNLAANDLFELARHGVTAGPR